MRNAIAVFITCNAIHATGYPTSVIVIIRRALRVRGFPENGPAFANQIYRNVH